MRVTFFAEAVLLVVLSFSFMGPATAQSKNLAPGFSVLPKGAKVVIMPTDIKLFSKGGGGVLEPKAEWTESAAKHFKAALLQSKHWRGLTTLELREKDADELAEIIALHAAVALAISTHHFRDNHSGLPMEPMPLPTKNGKLDWSMGEAVQPVKKITGADYALFTWIRDSYTSGGRAAEMVALGIVSILLLHPGDPGSGGTQIGYASLVNLNTGQVLWFNHLARSSGDLREAEKAAETLEALLQNFPASR